MSDYPFFPTDQKTKRFIYEGYLFSYANTNFGGTFLKRNYQMPVSALTEHIKSIIGLNNIKPWGMINFWYGYWNDERKSYSYVYEWDPETEWNDPDYIPNKFGINPDDCEDRLFILKTAPLPYEEEEIGEEHEQPLRYNGYDPYDKTTKLVDKKYIDDRFNGLRRVQVEKEKNTNSYIIKFRPYPCYYEIDDIIEPLEGGMQPHINIVPITDELNPIAEQLKFNKLEFYITFNGLKFKRQLNYPYVKSYVNYPIVWLLNGSPLNISWNYEDEDKVFYSKVLPDTRGYYRIKAVCEYIDGQWYARLSSDTAADALSKIKIEPINLKDKIKGKTCTKNIILTKSKINKAFLSDLPGDMDTVYINFDTSTFGPSGFPDSIDADYLYKWHYYIQTGDKTPIVLWSQNILWAMEDSYAYEPIFNPNKLYCLEFTKLLNGKLLGRIVYFINLINPPVIMFDIEPDDNLSVDLSELFTDKNQDTAETLYYSVRINWGDGSGDDYYCNRIDKKRAQHTYEKPGRYTITVTGRWDGWNNPFIDKGYNAFRREIT